MVAAEGDRPAVFLDRDGVLVVPEFRDGRSFAPRTLEAFALYPGAGDCLERLRAAGFTLIVVTNQPDVGHGLVARDVVEEMHRRLAAELPIDDIRSCFHRQEDGCTCRKPEAGMLFEAAAAFGISFARSFMVGDRSSDIEAGRRAGCRTVFIDLDYDEQKPANATYTVGSLQDATETILGAAPHRRGNP